MIGKGSILLHPSRWVWLLFLLLASGCALDGGSPTTPVRSLSLQPCQLSAPGLPTRLAAECGTLTVFEDRASGSGRQIQLKVAVVPTISRDPAPDPLFILAGGPGQAATEFYPQLASAFDKIHDRRDIVLVDQRGTGGSNPLDCSPHWDSEALQSGGSQELREALNSCLRQLDADPALYTTPLAMDDLDQVRGALGYERINLYGVSYGTRAALTYMRMYPDRVRSAILDGVWPYGVALGATASPSAQRALDLLFDRCAADAACGRAFPDVRAEFASVLETVRRGPVKVDLAHPITGVRTEMDLTADTLGTGIRLLSYSPETAALLPLLIHASQSTGDYRLLAAQSLMVAEDLQEGIAEGMSYSVTCAEDFPYYTLEEATRAGEGSYLGSTIAQGLDQVCALWPRGAVPADFNSPVQSPAPVLLLSGEADPVTPPSNGEFAARTLPNSLHLVAPGQGHGLISRGCVPDLAAGFVERGSTRGLDAGCVADLRPAPFFTSFAGPEP